MPESMLGRAEINSHIKVSKEEMGCNCHQPDYHRFRLCLWR